MSLYLCIFDGDTEVTGWVFGHYTDFGYFRDAIAAKLKADEYPILMRHSDCDGEWSPRDLRLLRSELRAISKRFRRLPAEPPSSAFEHVAKYCNAAKSLYDCFHNVDGENVFDALNALCDEGIRRGRPVLFQ